MISYYFNAPHFRRSLAWTCLWLCCLCTVPALAQERTITGRVSDEQISLPGVTVTVKGSTRGTTTDAEGTYRISVPNDRAVLVFSSVGFTSQETVVGNRSAINITLANDERALNEVGGVGSGS